MKRWLGITHAAGGKIDRDWYFRDTLRRESGAHALSYLPTQSLRFHVRYMRRSWQRRVVWFDKVSSGDLRRVLTRIRRDGPLTIRDIDTDALVEKNSR